MIVPDRRLVRIVLVLAAASLLAVPLPAIVLPLGAVVAAVAVLAANDAFAILREEPPALTVELPPRLRRDAPWRVTCRITSRRATRVTWLDELPPDLGGDHVEPELRLGAGESREVERTITPVRRGVRPVGPLVVLWASPLGLFWRRRVVREGGEVAVLPAPGIPESRLALTHRSVFEDPGLRPRRPRGEGTEFDSLREYVPGDDPRHLDWRAAARRGRLIVRQYRVERRHTLMIAVDTGRLMTSRVGRATKLDHALDCTLALGYASLRFGDRVGFVAFDREIRAFARPRDGVPGTARIAEASLPLEPRPFEPSYRALAQLLAARQKKRALVVVLTDFVEGSSSLELEGYLRLLSRRHCVLLVALRDRLIAEVETPAPGLGEEELYRRLAVQDLAVERQTALARIARLGVQTLDLDPAAVTAPVLQRYLAIREAGLL